MLGSPNLTPLMLLHFLVSKEAYYYNVHVVKIAKQDAGVPEPDILDASLLFGKHKGPNY